MRTFLVPLIALALPLGAEVQYQRDVRPVLSKKCFTCHGPDEHSRKANLRLDSFDHATGRSGGYPGIVAGNAKISRVAIRIADPARPMPPAGERLTATEIDILRQWIDEGAKYQAHWAFLAPRKVALPPAANNAWVRNAVDAFVLARLEKEGLKPSPEAPAAVLARRVALDLTGLPPDRGLADEYLKNPTDAAYEKLVDRLLESPHYGERWARIWLDLARYADSQGYEKDNLRTIWPYRDWVIAALNRNMPFDQFAIKQIAGDLLPNPSESDLIATGFHRNTMTNTEGGTDDEEFRDIAVRDRVATTGVAFMGLTWGCAQCHSHKYDPLSQKEFYQLYAFFNQTEDSDKPDDRPVLKLASDSTPIFRELPEDKRRQTRIFERGNFLNPGDPVEAAVPQAFHAFPPDAPRNRLGLAKWLVDRNNPLTARVQVNRYWARLFGRGLVESEEDFGTQGQLPSHPELLDWLSVEFMERGWDMKALLKTIVMSATYRQSAAVSPELRAKDPNNVLLAHGARFRIDAEMVRDQALALSGLLDRKLYGPPVMPWQPDGIWQVVYSGAQWETGSSEERYRRAIYTLMRRTTPYPAMQMFDAPSGEVCTARRIRTNTPLQALASLNDPALMEAAQNLGLRAAEEKGSEADRAARLFERLTLRKPSETEQKRIVALYRDAAADLKKDAEATHRLLNYGQRLYLRDREAPLLGDGREEGAQWRYVNAKPPGDWQQAGFNDSDWLAGAGQFGLLAVDAKKPEPLLRTKWDTEELWLRREFTVPQQGIEAPRLVVRTDAAFEAYVNGVPAASTDMNRSGYYGYALPKEALAAIKPGRNVLAIHAKRSYEPVRGQVFDAGLVASRPVAHGEMNSNAVARAAWIMVANALLNLDEVLVHP